MATVTPYAMTPSLSFSQIPGSVPGNVVPEDIDLTPVPALAKEALGNLEKARLCEDAIWRDFFALTGRLRTFNGSQAILSGWKTQTGNGRLRDIRIDEPRVSRMTASSSWVDIAFTFSFEGREGLARNCFGILSLIIIPDTKGGLGKAADWKVWMLRTMLENFEGCGHPDDPSPIFSNPPLPSPTAASSSNFKEKTLEFEVVILGAGQCGLSLAGRLGALGINYLLLEKEKEIGYSWTGKYDSVRQHTVKEMNNLPFERTYRSDDPILLPAKTVARGFREYVEKYQINLWLGGRTEECERMDGRWELNVRLGNGVKVLKAKHLVLAMGGGVSIPTPPDISGKDKFKGVVLDIGTYKNCHDWKGKKGIVVGTGTGAHDVAQDMLDVGLEQVTMIQRGHTPVFPVEWLVQIQSSESLPPDFRSVRGIGDKLIWIIVVYNTDIPPETADRLVSLMPLKIERELIKINLGGLVSANSSRFDDIEKSGFKVDRDAVLTDLLLLRGGGYYIDVGTSKRIADGDIKVKSGVMISKFTENGLAFEDGEEIEADLVVFATGYEKDIRRQAAGIVGDEIAGALPQSRVLNAEGEVSGPMTPGGKRLQSETL
jgi:hypothetical protein